MPSWPQIARRIRVPLGFGQGGPVRGVAVLIGVEISIRLLLVSATRFTDGAVASIHRVREDELGTVNLQQLLALRRHVRWKAGGDKIRGG